MKNKLVYLFLALLLIIPAGQVSAQQDLIGYNNDQTPIAKSDYSLVKDKKIREALDLLIGTDGEWARKAIAGHNETNYPIKIQFENLAKICPTFKDLDALGWLDEKDRLIIFVNEKHKNAPTGALAPLLAHESLHQDRNNSIKEETYAANYEAEIWIQLKAKDPALKNIQPGENSLVDRENLLEMLFRQTGFKSTAIEQKIRENPSYKNLPETSPGFGM